jgi:hypothetical protein
LHPRVPHARLAPYQPSGEGRAARFSSSGTISGTNVELLPIGCCLAPGGALILSNLVLTNQNAAATSSYADADILTLEVGQLT